MLLHKTLSFSDVELKMEGETGQFAGYASVFGGVDSYGDTITKGAFSESLSKGMPKMFWNHQWDMPVGKWTVAKEDSKGLWVEGELTSGLSVAADIRAAMKHNTLDGLSIGGFVKKGDYEDTADGRVINKWSRLVEISPVAFPADNNARISTVKSGEMIELIEGIDSVRDFEAFLRDASGLSKGAALALTARVKTLFGQGEPATDVETKAIEEMLARLARAADPLKL